MYTITEKITIELEYWCLDDHLTDEASLEWRSFVTVVSNMWADGALTGEEADEVEDAVIEVIANDPTCWRDGVTIEEVDDER